MMYCPAHGDIPLEFFVPDVVSDAYKLLESAFVNITNIKIYVYKIKYLQVILVYCISLEGNSTNHSVCYSQFNIWKFINLPN